MTRILTYAAMVLLLFGSPVTMAYAVDYFVTDQGAASGGAGTAGDPFGTITEALGAPLMPGDVINIAAGTYDNSEETYPLVLPDGVTLSGAGSGATILDSTGSGGYNITHSGGSNTTILRNIGFICDGEEGVRISGAASDFRVTSCVFDGGSSCSDLLQIDFDGSGTVGLVVRNCRFFDMTGECIDLENTDAAGDWLVCLSSNTFSGTGNSFSQLVEIDVSCSDTSMSFTFKATGNEFYNGSSTQLAFYLLAYSDAIVNADVDIRSNTCSSAGTNAIAVSFSMTESGELNADIEIICNYVVSAANDGINIYMYGETAADGSLSGTVSGNSVVRVGDDGIELTVSGSSSTISVDVDFLYNCVLSASSTGIDLYYSDTGDLDLDADNVIYCNVIRFCAGNGIRLYGQEASGTVSVSDDFGGGNGGALLGLNTIDDNATSTGSQFWMSYTDSGATIFARGNWWGTMSLSAIESRVFHNPDSGSLATLDFGSPLSDVLALTLAAPPAGGLVTINADDAYTKFLQFAGKKQIEVTVGGFFAINPQVSADNMSVTFGIPPVAGSFLVVITNPGGQTGSLTITLTGGPVSRCFVATAAYGDEDAPEVLALRRLRDEHLADNLVGRQLVKAYYALSPCLAEVISERPWAQTVSRAALAPVVGAARLWMEMPWAYALGGLALAFGVLRKRRN